MFSLFQMILLFRLRYVFADHHNQVYLIWEQKYHQWEDIAKRMICFDLKKPISKVCSTWSYLVVYLVTLEKTFTKTNAKNYNCTHEKKDKMNGYRQCLLFSVREECPNTEFFQDCIFPSSDWIQRFHRQNLGIQSEYGEIRTTKNSVFVIFSRSVSWRHLSTANLKIPASSKLIKCVQQSLHSKITTNNYSEPLQLLP